MMTRRLASVLIGLFAIVSSALITFADEKSEPFKIVFIAYENPDQLVEDLEPVVDYLEKKLKRPIKHFVATDYAGVVEALRAKRADMGFMGALQYCIAHEQAGAIPILGEIYNGKSTYLARIFVREDSGLEKLEDLRGRTMAFVDPISSSGYMYPLEIFKKAGLIASPTEASSYFKRVYFAGGDEQAIRAVLNGFVDAAGIGQYAHRLLRPEEREAVVSIADSRPIPSHCVVVRKELKPATIQAIQEALLALNEGPDRKLLKYLYNVDGYKKVTSKDYEAVARMARSFGLLKGN